ncbi:MAG: hypothetical protein G3M78_13110 [Candidatus Nitrohelix vancouverensis]|uniref:Uncharacterized protein n=1 Tax=Candidatus Nitrohelix vancouverensis TaxID=2705534 RepID=A0A7T0C499_9BACT|nr:MAG: hypothetical protein G3M78_13110 [Candidatus Nitrohelix vancouverensis]
MEQPQWAIKDYETGHDALIDLEDPETPSLYAVRPDLTLVLAEGLPVFGFHWIGAVMIAPALVFMLILILLPVFVLTGSDVTWIMAIVTLVVSSSFLWGFTFALQLMVQNRDIFPRRYFTTLGNEGLALHFSRIHLPGQNPKAWMEWASVQSVELSRRFFLPGILVAKPFIPYIDLKGSGDRRLSIPLSPNENDIQSLVERIRRQAKLI